MKKLFVILFSLFLCIFFTQAVSPNYYFKQISLKDGLSQSTVNCVLSDHQGVIWIGTNFGLNRFDRERIVSYYNDKDNLFSIPGNDIIFLTEDLLHNIWIGSDRGLARYDRSKDEFVRITFAGLPMHIFSSVVTDNGVLFFGAGTAFRYSYADNRITFLPVNGPEKMVSFFTHACMYDKQKQIVLLSCRRNGLWWYHLATGKLERVPFIPAKEVASVCLASSGDIWLSVYADGVYGYTREGQERYHLNTSNLLNNDVVLDIKERNGELWLATDGGGINIYDPEKQIVRVIAHVPGDNNSLPVNSFGCLYSDQEKNMWAGSIRGGLIGMKEICLYTYGNMPLNSTGGLSHKTVTSLYEDRDHILWFGTDGEGINRFDPQTGLFRHYPATFDKKVVSIIDYGEDELLLSIFSLGLYRFNKESGQLWEYNVAGIEKSRRLFRSGLAVHLDRRDEERFYIYSDSVYLYNQSAGRLETMKCEEDGVVLSALMKAHGDQSSTYLRSSYTLLALDHEDRSIHVFYTPPDSIGMISAVCLDKEGCFWLGTSSGLYCYDPATKQISSIERGRFAGTRSLGFDRQGRLWIGTHNGLYAYIPGERKTVVFGESDGVYANEYLFKPPLLTKSGDMYMAGVNGLVYIRNNVPFPEEADPSINLLDVELDGISVGSDVIEDNSKLTIPWNYTSLNARIIVKENDLMRKKLFRYYIKGNPDEMIERSSHTISFHALSVGEYHIWVSCNKRNGDWSTPVHLLAITVTPPWWKTTGFLVLLISLILGGSVLAAWLIVLKKERKMTETIKEHERKTYEDKLHFLINLSPADEQFMRRLNDLISSNLTNPDLDVQFVAAQMAMSRASLYNKLKLLAGISIGDYINKFRMAEAVRLLADKDLSIQEVSEKTGFSHQRYFSTVFKQIYGMTPSQYRQDL
ncbi:helix-turn-helix domain-containing protein [Parabacteroides sp. N37]|uniref:Helix-turn-helix domain-containing protein n=1 Tax=Parabacteroides hominis TaxID=2763057 RepID=A0ABR7DNC7_9BACT|nr:helix-turn-helix domain-containing protein [Parabacteroides hominis]